ncbi:pyridine nucleotide-disulfide oxidoreductase [Pseudomonas sp. CCI3.2]|uniref:pyridine nucleotide-disulfide oxidoreductase n=1 Tax=unclassified Pseudomonas TaxID=196821 RepID=UPI002AC95D54|nr:MULTISPECIES: pyridine nucleotide-disulfide oxidoreductase [unclassified Pseudomonas]MEB0079967.1 pyridine nucleotide-disulfide oxidoreductase [Pseudomonas sp. MH10out]MEB0093984.1 pyridine nucleotide-disulfide oxidoreductase [Pseudomonas sp. CCI4.2]MEB0102439.1 pyridine nucleotide-disulfide oxidoreductase [Pseudomonas sp. CCI3.2]MEB0133102.1 pyridine nucleotide-disulfide oxidoreductase [Pseudomonas sp. CCI2.4]MEB0160283.1 pyridine nucleotide-disulfide oxidoreductase [Pseudomonas sp. AH2 (2
MLGNQLETLCGCVIGGAGPAGMGLIFNALKSGSLPEMARHGLIIVDASPLPGIGRLGDYRITANSVGDVFLDCLRDPALRDVFEPLERSPAYWRIRNQAFVAPLLSDVGELLAEASKLVLDHLVEHFAVEVWSSTTISEVVSSADEYQVWVEHKGRSQVIRCRSLVLNLGGHQDPQHLLKALADQGLALPPATSVQSADTLLRMSAQDLRAHFAPTLAKGGRLTVVGGSHSAFSMLENLGTALQSVGLEELTLVHRSQIRLFYESVEQALASGYVFDPVNDVCPVSGRVNRSGGLRYSALEVGRNILQYGRISPNGVRVRLLQSGPGVGQQYGLASQALADSSVVVQCTGYQPRLPAMKYADGSPIKLREVKGGLDSDPSGCPLDSIGQRMHGLYLFGLGSGLGIDPRLGSEPSFDGRIYGVWQFHNDASRVAIESVSARLSVAVAETVVPDRRRQARVQDDRPFFWPSMASAKF